MKLLIITFLAFSIQSSNFSVQPPDAKIYFGRYCLEKQETHWNLVLKNKIFTFTCEETKENYSFRYNACNDDQKSLKICSTDNMLVTLTFLDLKEMKTCEGTEETHFTKLVFDMGEKSKDEGSICCKD